MLAQPTLLPEEGGGHTVEMTQQGHQRPPGGEGLGPGGKAQDQTGGVRVA